ncbi:MAG: ABC transporter permease [Acidimicrobiales bacterium]
MSAATGAFDGFGAEPANSARRLVDLIFRARELGIIVVLALFVGATATIQPRFVDGQNIKFVFYNATIYALLALGETMVVIARHIDLSNGAVLGLSAYLSANLFSEVHGIPIVAVFGVGLGIGVACGLLNGAATTVLRVPSLVITLATMYIFRAIDVIFVGGGLVVASSLPNAFLAIASSSIGPVPYVTLGVALLIAVGAYYLRSFRSGRDLYAIGSNPDAARLAGIAEGRRVFIAFVLSGAISGVAGVLWAANYGTVDSTAGTGYVLLVIASVVVGGVNIFGGSGTVVGAALGALLLATIYQALDVLGISPFWDDAIAGALILVAISLDRLITVRLTRALRKRSPQRAT